MMTAAGRQNMDYWALPRYRQIASHERQSSTSPDGYAMERNQKSTGAPSTPRGDNNTNIPSGRVAMTASQSEVRKTNTPRSRARTRKLSLRRYHKPSGDSLTYADEPLTLPELPPRSFGKGVARRRTRATNNN